MYACESWNIKKAEHQRNDAFKLWCWRRLLRVPWTARRSSQSILKEISPGCSLEGLVLKLKLQYFGHLMQRTNSFPDAGTDWRQEEKGTTEDVMVGWHHRLDGHEFEQALGVGDRQGGLACCNPWGRKEWDTIEQLNWTDRLVDYTQQKLLLRNLEAGNQSWIFTGRTDVEAETPILWLPDAKNWLIPWCWERLKAGGEGDNRGWDCWMVSPTRWAWVWASSGSWWWIGKPGVL